MENQERNHIPERAGKPVCSKEKDLAENLGNEMQYDAVLLIRLEGPQIETCMKQNKFGKYVGMLLQSGFAASARSLL